MIEIEKINFEKLNGIVPAIIVDSNTKQVLMLGFMNREAVEITIQTKKVTFFSRTKNRIWTKGETSGNFLLFEKMYLDCDYDTILIFADPLGNTCHLGRYSCFGFEEEKGISFFQKLYQIILDRKDCNDENSYTKKLFDKGENKIIQKFGEEAVEVIIAAKNNDGNEIINEVSDLFYHLLVLLTSKNISLENIVENLEKRHN
ncbi:MAG: bifunctional phosphoribosyl-AMP cyclohydrolase/phosphoribosyl-ATP diphosphatase HisIE [Ignavibacteriales bacterium]|nr:bifunctional phosphoribosyl-AMP cyclohydrolase/phosphoribosyl-ATP diphosphatase HisIE [Ignavibacteriales bacterium]